MRDIDITVRIKGRDLFSSISHVYNGLSADIGETFQLNPHALMVTRAPKNGVAINAGA